MIAGVYHLNLLPLLAGGAILAGCTFTAGWVLRGERDLYLRATGRRRGRARRPEPGRLRW